MLGKTFRYGSVIDSYEMAEGIYSLSVEIPEIAATAVPGQFVSIFTEDGAHLMPRPISICDIDHRRDAIRFVYRVAGYGTKEFSELGVGDSVRVMGPLGNGYPIDEILKTDESSDLEYKKNIVLIGGGIGIPPLYYLAKKLKKNNINLTAVVGYRSSDTFLLEDLLEISDKIVIATDDGTMGTKGTVIDAIEERYIEADVICACGPIPMLRGVKTLAKQMEIKAYISLEERMACGIGACLGCVCKTAEVDEHSKVNNTRICSDGPVFDASDVIL